MRTLKQLIDEYGYPVLTEKEYSLVQEHKVNWSSLDGEIIIRKCLRSYPAYLEATNFGYKMTAYHYSLAANLQRNCEKGPNVGKNGKPLEYSLILLSAPPQTGKSLTITENFQSWLLINNPRLNILTIGYEATFAARFGRRNRDKFSEYAPIFTHGNVKLSDRVQSVETWETMTFDKSRNIFTPANGAMYTAGMGGALTGKTGNYIIVDDPIKNMQDAMSDTVIENNIEYYQSAIETRARGNPGSVVIVMCTRWVTRDLIGWLRTNRADYIVGDYNYAALCDERNQLVDPLYRDVGEGICPEMGKDGDWAENIRDSYMASEGSHVYNALFQGEPTDEQGNLYHKDAWRYFRVTDWHPEEFDRIYLSIDATFTDKITSDFVSMKVGGIKGGNDYWRYAVRKRMDLPDTLDKILKIVRKFREIDVIYIEDKANGPGIISVLRKWRRKLGISDNDFPAVYPIQPEGGKYSRAQGAAVYQRDGHCYILDPRDGAYFSDKDDFDAAEYVDMSSVDATIFELSIFPYGAHDDLVDAHSQSIIKNVGLLIGEEKPTVVNRRFARYTQWYPEQEEDYKKLRSVEQKREFIRLNGANIKWKPKNEGGTYGVI